MYKVFIENSSLNFIEEKDFKLDKGLILYHPTVNELERFVLNYLLEKENVFEIQIVITDLDSFFSEFKSKFDYVEAAGGIVKRKEKYLFIKRNGKWDIPKGKIDEGESPENCAVREIVEECGIEVPILIAEIVNTYHMYRFKGVPTIKKTFWYSLDYKGSKVTKAQKEEGITKVDWLISEELIKVKKNTFPSILLVLNTYFKNLT
jgi:8-oxo-dGTP pyrophosphatase MutT (NUDIX family)